MSREELLAFCRGLYEEKGLDALSYPALKAIPKLYSTLYANGLSQKALLQDLGLVDAYKAHLEGKPYRYGDGERSRWSWPSLIEKARAIKEKQGRLPPALWFQKNGHAALVQALYNMGRTWDQLREAVGDFSDSNFVQARNGTRWLSHAEASLSNFLHARGIEHKKGERYDKSFGEVAETRYAIYDLHFRGKDGSWFDVEVWGDRPNGHNEERYARTRKAKEEFNAGNPRFMGIHHADCYDEEKLTRILEPAIGIIEPFRFDKPTDALIHSTHWSNADELLAFCRELAAKMPDGKLPAEDWLRKRGRWASREGEAYNTAAVYINRWLGGTRAARKLLGQEAASTQQWDRVSALASYKDFFERHGMTPQQARQLNQRKKDVRVSDEVAKEAARVSSAVQKYAGGADAANDLLDIKPERQRKWSKDTLKAEIRRLFAKYAGTPHQLIRANQTGKITLPAEELRLLKQIGCAASRFPGGMRAICIECGISSSRLKK